MCLLQDVQRKYCLQLETPLRVWSSPSSLLPLVALLVLVQVMTGEGSNPQPHLLKFHSKSPYSTSISLKSVAPIYSAARISWWRPFQTEMRSITVLSSFLSPWDLR